MKKIVGIIGAVAIATSLFAADVSSGTKINGKLFNYGTDEKLQLFSQGNDSHDYANPNFVFGISGDKAGASLKITTDGGTLNPKQTTQTIWFKPIDALKITAGNFDVALNKEQIDWTESVTALGGNGYLVSFNSNGFGLDLGLHGNSEGAFWLEKAKDTEDAAGNTVKGNLSIKRAFAKASYGADFGTIGAYLCLNQTVDGWQHFVGKCYNIDSMKSKTREDGLNADGTKKYKKAAIESMDFGIGYQNNFNGVNVFANFVGNMADSFEWIRPEVFVSGSVDAFGYQFFAAPLIYTNSNLVFKDKETDEVGADGKWVKKDLAAETECEISLKVSYAFDGVTSYVYFNDKNILAKNFASTIKVGAQGSCGSMSWNTWFQIDTGNKVLNAEEKKADYKAAFSVPFELSINF